MVTFIVTGDRNEGKTSFLRRLIHYLKHPDKRINGFISPGKINKSGSKDFILQFLTEKQSVHLASREKYPGYDRCGAFFFNPKAVNKGKAIIEESLKSMSNIIIMDEIGPVELQGEVWHDPLKDIIKNYTGILIITVRKEMLERVKEYFEIVNPFIVDIKKINPEKAAEIILGS